MHRLPLAAVSLLLIACTGDPVKWDAETRSPTLPPAASHLELSAADLPVVATAWNPPAIPSGVPLCAGSFVAVRAKADTAYSVWWSPRADSSARLVVARSEDRGMHWDPPETADSTDRPGGGCARPAPFMVADTTNGYVHVVYFMNATEGPGVFFTHSMGAGEMFHSPVAIMYGDRASPAAVACNGDTVAVAFLDPNSVTPQLWLALSRTTGHIFEEHMEVSSGTAAASRPAVAVRGHHLAVSWVETNRGDSAGVSVTRTGRWR
jgi:hypothetical protein